MRIHVYIEYYHNGYYHCSTYHDVTGIRYYAGKLRISYLFVESKSEGYTEFSIDEISHIMTSFEKENTK